ncbi:Hypothetical predicted protein [Cloeon dipterum]|uniref:C2H2-type domain-containing protein n=1 Tax=Cloeon dipterum TaxID=197152 RepID=A0A8S1C7X5_9INSE|nr:Hypothetical predicted protein [Cloeon dipterum]
MQPDRHRCSQVAYFLVFTNRKKCFIFAGKLVKMESNAESATKSKNSDDSNESRHVCVLCSSVLPSKEELQDHFRKHANKVIDYRGQPMNRRFVLKTEAAQPAAPPKPAAAAPIKPAVNKVTPPIKSCTVYGTKLKNVNLAPEPKVVIKAPPVVVEAAKEPAEEKKQPLAIECDVCAMPFETITQAIQHKFRKHPNSSLKYYCPFCGMQFPLKYNQETHLEKEHPGAEEKGDFPCSYCDVIFKTPEGHAYHIKSNHKRIVAFFKPIVTPPPSKKIKVNNAREAQSVYYCHLCGFEYIVKFNLQKHLERQHTAEERDAMPTELMKCTTCDALFYNKKAYENHNMYHRPDDLYVTSEEQRLQTVSRVDQDFDIRRVIQPVDKYMAKVRSASMGKRRSRDSVVQPLFSNLSDSELSPASTPPTSDSEDEPADKAEKATELRVESSESEPLVKKTAKTITYGKAKSASTDSKTAATAAKESVSSAETGKVEQKKGFPQAKKARKEPPVAPVPTRNSARIARSKVKC